MEVDEGRLEMEVKAMTENANLEDLTVGDLRARVEESLGVSITDKVMFSNIVKRVLSEVGQQVEDEEDDDMHHGGMGLDHQMGMEHDMGAEKPPPPRATGGGGGGLKTKKYVLSEPLATWLGLQMETRPQVVKKIWDYIKENKLQDSADKRRIHLDDALQNIFGVKIFTMFSMQKILSKHLKKEGDDTPFDLDPGDEDYETIAKPDPEKRKRKEMRRGRKIKKKRRPPGPNAKPNGFKKPIRVSEVLRNFMGQDMCSRGDVVKKLWEYIKEKDLQNPENRREIFCDETLQGLFDRDRVTSFSMNKYIQPHFLKDEPPIPDVPTEDKDNHHEAPPGVMMDDDGGVGPGEVGEE